VGRPGVLSSAPARGLRVATAALLAIGLTAAVAWGALGLLIETPWIFPDELLYAEMAKSLAAGNLPAVRDVATGDLGLLYPLLLAPIWALSPDGETAFWVARMVNAALMSLAAIPAFLLARRFVAAGPALVVALFTVLVPSMAYVGTLLTEVALYPAFLLALLGITAAVERPTRRNQLLALGAIAVVFGIKALGVVLLAVYPAAIVLFVLLDRRSGARRHSLGSYRLSWISLLGSIVFGLMVGIALAGDPIGLLGAYAVAAGHVDLLMTLRWFVGNLSALALFVAVIPFAATLIVLARGVTRGAPRAWQLFAAVTIPTILAVLGTVAAFGSGGTGGAEGFVAATELRERNFFVIGPLLLLALAMLIQARERGGRVFAIAGVTTAAVLIAYPWDHAPVSAGPQNLSPVPWIFLTPEGPIRNVAVGVCGVLLLVLFRWTPWNRIGRVWVAVATIFVFTGVTASLVFANAAERTIDWGSGRQPGWIDAAVGPGETVAVLWYEPHAGFARPAARHRVVWMNEFFNDTVEPVYALGGRMPYALPETLVRLDARGVVERLDGRPVRETYVLACGLRIDATVVARDPQTAATLYRTAGRIRVVPGVTRCGGSTAESADVRARQS
jgi:hypothetical protein